MSRTLRALVAIACCHCACAFAQLTLAPDPLPIPATGVFYNITFSASGGQAPYQYMLAAGRLPAGISLTGGTLAGTVAATTPIRYTIVAADANGREATPAAAAGASEGIQLAGIADTVFGQAIQATATVSGSTPTGTIEFCADGSPADPTFCASGTPLCAGGIVLVPVDAASSSASCADANLNVNAHAITAYYAGDAVNVTPLPSAAAALTVHKAQTSLDLTPPTPTATLGSPITVVVAVAAVAPGAGLPGGSVSVDDGAGSACAFTLSGATGSCQLVPTQLGDLTLAAHYPGDASFLGSAASSPIKVVPPVHLVMANAGANGSITPASQYVADGDPATFAVTATPGYVPNVGGTCPPGSFGNGTYWTGPIAADCTVMATFASADSQINLLVTDNHDYARYGMLLDYIVTASNNSAVDVSGLSIAADAGAAFNGALGHWLCLGSNTQCIAQGQGALADNAVRLPAKGSVSWVVSEPVLAAAAGATADFSVTLNGPTFAAPLLQTDSDILVIFRDSLDVANADGTRAVTPDRWDGEAALGFALPPLTDAMMDTPLAAAAGDGAGFRVERLNGGSALWLRAVTYDAAGERASAWTRVAPQARLLLGIARAGTERALVLVGAEQEITVPLPGTAGSWRLHGAPQARTTPR